MREAIILETNNLVGRVLDIIEFMSLSKHSLSLKEIARKTNIPSATAYRILSTLKERGYVGQRSNKDYYLTYKMYALSGRVMENDTYVDKILPFMNYFALKVKDSGISLTAFCENSCLNLISVGTSVKFRAKLVIPGAAFPLHCTAAGKLFLSCFSEEQLNNWLSDNILFPYTRNTLIDPDDLKRELENTRKQGYGTINSEMTDDLSVISIPVHEKDGQIDLAINFSVEKTKFHDINNPEFVQWVKDMLKKYNVI